MILPFKTSFAFFFESLPNQSFNYKSNETIENENNIYSCVEMKRKASNIISTEITTTREFVVSFKGDILLRSTLCVKKTYTVNGCCQCEYSTLESVLIVCLYDNIITS